METTAFERLKGFISTRMSMSHIYQPVMLRTILTNGGSATVRDIAMAFLVEDESQIEYYEHIVKRWPDATLRKRHNLVTRVKDVYGLTDEVSGLTEDEAAKLVSLCNRRLEEYKEHRGSNIWHHREYGLDQIPGKTRYEVLKRAKGRCQLCGIPKEQRFLDVDHIKPRKAGGTNDIDNLQSLCWKCNAAKGAGDDTDFRKPW